nr:PDZ domain-containing protein [Pseudomonas sp.]
LVAQVVDNGPAAKGGLQVGDVILSVNDKAIVVSADLPHLIGTLKPGDSVRLDVVREGERKRITLAVGALPEEGEEVAAAGGAERSSNRMGVTVVELNEEQRRALDLPFGVAVKEVQGGPAALIGLRPGDVITHLNNRAIDSAKTFTQIAQALPTNRSVSMRVLRQGRASFITFRLAE